MVTFFFASLFAAVRVRSGGEEQAQVHGADCFRAGGRDQPRAAVEGDRVRPADGFEAEVRVRVARRK